MKKLLLLLLIPFCFISTLYAQNLTIATYNIRNENQYDYSRGNGWKQRCPVITQLIRFHDFDIFGAQEVLYGQVNDMLSQLPEYSYVGVGRDDGKNAGEFSPIFYKKEKLLLLQSGTFWLSETDDKPSVGWDAALPRICTWGKFQIKESGSYFWFFTLHMDHIGVKARLESSKLVLNKIMTLCGNEPVILTGDFNVDQTNDGYKFLADSGHLFDTYETADIRYAQNGTFNDFNPTLKTDSRIDHVFTTKALHATRHGVLTDSYWSTAENSATIASSDNTPKEQSHINRPPSDHYPVVVKITFVH